MKHEDFDQLALARRIRSAGRPIHIPEDDGEARPIPSDELRVCQTGSEIDSTAFDVGGGTGFKIYLVITFNTAGFAISRFQLKLPWAQTNFIWLEDPRVIDGRCPNYSFYSGESLEFERSLVINHFADVRQRFSAGESIEGYLLGRGFDSIPAHIPHGTMIPAFVILYDQFAREFRAPVSLWADRSKKRSLRAQSGVPRRGGLLSKRDVITGG